MRVSKITRVAVDRLRINEGQLDWLPKNPRTWTQTDIDRMVRSIEEDPDFADVRPVLAVPGPDGSLVVFAHNLLTRAAQVRGDRDLPVAVFEPETDDDRETVRRLAIKDNGSFGAWDYDALANEWDDNPLGDWGVPAWNNGEDETEKEDKTDLSDQIDYEFKLEIECENEAEQEKMYNELTERGFKCKVLTL